jgi:acyl-CoA synthetase (AMP-forming)/AMP-acid ligase II
MTFIPPGTIPKTSSGKIQRQACKADFLAGTFEALGAANGNETRL